MIFCTKQIIKIVSRSSLDDKIILDKLKTDLKNFQGIVMNKLYRMTKEEFEQKKILYQFDDVKYIVIIETYEQYFDKLWKVAPYD